MFTGKRLLTSQLNATNILLRVKEEDIFSRYICPVKSPITSPFRKDTKPSCGFYTNKYNKLILHDFAKGEAWNCFEAVMKKLDLSFGKTLQLINQDFNLGLGTASPSEVKVFKEEVSTDVKPDIKFSIKPYEKHELDYWARYGASPEVLVKFGIYAVQNVEVGTYGWKTNKNSPIFVYIFNHNMFKIYRPLNKEGRKWLDQTLGLNVGGLPQLPPKGKLLIITKSYKDVMTLYKLGFPAICPMTETATINTRIIKALKLRFDHIISLYDPDPTGMAAATKLYDQQNIPYMFLTKEKDISDFYFKYGFHTSFRVLKKHISKTFNNHEKYLLYSRVRPGSSKDLQGIRSLKDNSNDIPF